MSSSNPGRRFLSALAGSSSAFSSKATPEGRTPGRRLLAALAGSTPAFSPTATPESHAPGRRLLAALAGSTPAFTPQEKSDQDAFRNSGSTRQPSPERPEGNPSIGQLYEEFIRISQAIPERNNQFQILKNVQRAVEIGEQLGKIAPQAFRSLQISSIALYSAHLSEAGLELQAFENARRAIDLFYDTRIDRVELRHSGMAEALPILSFIMLKAKEFDQALHLAEITAELSEELAKENFETYAPYQIRSLNLLTLTLLGSGHQQQAIASAERAVDLSEKLVGIDGKGNESYLIESKNTLAMTLSTVASNFPRSHRFHSIEAWESTFKDSKK